MSTSFTSVPVFPTWKTITIGTHKSVEDLQKALTGNGFQITGWAENIPELTPLAGSDWAADILKRTPLAEQETEIKLVLVTVADLGFTKATRRDKIYARAKELGLDVVPAEVGVQLRFVYSHQPMGEWILVGMEPIADFAGRLGVFFVGRSVDGLWLFARCGYPDVEWHPDERWVFARRK